MVENVAKIEEIRDHLELLHDSFHSGQNGKTQTVVLLILCKYME